MDIDYLLLLQEFRNSTNSVLDPAMEFISELSISVWPIMAIAIIYWLFDKRQGSIFLRAFGLGEVVNGILKLTACVYRPWIRDSRIIPAGDSLTTATGYSFPSGHSTRATFLYGTASVWQWKKHRWASIVLLVLMFLTFFSRNYLGVHTPQDVIVGFAATTCVVWFSYKIQSLLDSGKITDAECLMGTLFLVLFAYIYITAKSYPLDYVNDQLLVDPEKMKPDTYQAFGFLLAFSVGSYCEKRFVRFDNAENRKNIKCIVVCVIALVPLYFIYDRGVGFLTDSLGKAVAKMLTAFMTMLYVTLIVPAVMKAVGGHTNKQ